VPSASSRSVLIAASPAEAHIAFSRMNQISISGKNR
jgi:hypothetical protein